MTVTHLIINYISFDNGSITVGATDNERWVDELEEGYNGGDAFSFIQAKIIERNNGYAPQELIEFLIRPEYEPHRTIAENSVKLISRIAWDIKNRNLSQKQAIDLYFGKRLLIEPIE
jgi:hypothetical protein